MSSSEISSTFKDGVFFREGKSVSELDIDGEMEDPEDGMIPVTAFTAFGSTCFKRSCCSDNASLPEFGLTGEILLLSCVSIFWDGRLDDIAVLEVRICGGTAKDGVDDKDDLVCCRSIPVPLWGTAMFQPQVKFFNISLTHVPTYSCIHLHSVFMF